MNHLTSTGGKKKIPHTTLKIKRKTHHGKLIERSLFSIWIPSTGLETLRCESCLQRLAREALILSAHSDRKILAYISGPKKKNGEKFSCIFNPLLPQNTTLKRTVIMSLPVAKTVKSQKKWNTKVNLYHNKTTSPLPKEMSPTPHPQPFSLAVILWDSYSSIWAQASSAFS